MQSRIQYRLGLDLGTNSIGWCLLKLNNNREPIHVIRMGSRIFPDGRNPKDGASLAVDRRLARQMRRRRDRFIRRRRRLLDALVQYGLMPADKTERKRLVSLDPYQLRKEALDNPLPPYHIGRAIFHLNQRRGFNSNRKTDKSGADDSGKIKNAIKQVRAIMDADKTIRTFGEWLAIRHEKREPVRARLRGKGAKATYDLYIDRSMIEHEFDTIWRKQAEFNAQLLSAEAREKIRDILLYQRPLKPVKPGRCTFEPSDYRAPIALPYVQRFRIYQEVNNLRLINEDFQEEPLTLEQRDLLVEALERQSKPTFDRIRRLLKLGDAKFNLESENRDHLKGNATSIQMAKDSLFGGKWHEFTTSLQDEIVEKLLDEENEAELISWLQKKTGVEETAAIAIANIRLPEGYSNIGRKALTRILPELKKGVIPYSEAVIRAGYQSHSQFHDGEILSELPYYGQILTRHVAFGSNDPNDPEEKRYGRIANPTVHVGLNQLRKLVNAIIERYGHPAEVIVEVARDLKNSKARKDEIREEQKKRQDQNDSYRKKLEELGLPVNSENMLRLRLWHELNINDPNDRRCPYTGEQISITRLFSPEVEIDHILPFSKTLDDSLMNKVVSMRYANRDKGNRTPFEAFGHSPSNYDWPAVLTRVANMPKGKSLKFAPDALDRFLKDKDFLARQLNDTAYLSRIAKEYLTAVCPPNCVWVTTGHLTAMLRGKWGLNNILSDSGKKERADHRHHAIDAAVIGVTDRGLLQRLARASALARERQLGRLVEEMPLPWPDFRREVTDAVNRIIVSYKPDHSVHAQLHNDTAYGIVSGPDDNGRYEVVHRVPIDSFKRIEDLSSIRDAKLRNDIEAYVGTTSGKEIQDKLREYSEKTGIRRLRITEPLSVIPIRHRGNGQVYKSYKGDSNYCVEIYKDATGEWKELVLSTFEANQIFKKHKDTLRDPRLASNGLPLVMRLMKNDIIAIQKNGVRQLMRLAKFTSGQMSFAEHFEANADKRERDRDDGFSYFRKSANSLRDIQARRVFVDYLGFVKDPGFRE